MQFNTKLNIGDTVWIICRSSSCIREVTVTGVEISTIRTPHIVTYVTDANVFLTDDEEGTVWWKTRDAILSYIMTSINARAKSKSEPKTDAEKLSEEFWKVFTDPIDDPKYDGDYGYFWKVFTDPIDDPKYDGDYGYGCGCGCESRPHLPEEDEMGRLFGDSYTEFERIFGKENKEKYQQAIAEATDALKKSAKTAKVILGNTRSELNDLYEQVFGKEKKS